MWLSDYCTQLGPDGYGHDRCWAACIASALLTFGWQSDPYGLMRDVTAKGPGDDHTEDVADLIATAEAMGIHGRPWTGWHECEEALAADEVPIALIANHLLIPRPYPPGAGWEALHYVRIRQVLDDGSLIYLYDPLCYLPQPLGGIYQGPTVVTYQSLTAAIMATPNQYAGVILTRNPPEGVT
jgi:hypothetical protein